MLSDKANRAERELAAAERAAASAELKEKRREYDAINDEADVLFRNDDYEAAIVIYEKALAILPDERYPQQRITEAQKRINEAAGIDESDDNVSEEEVSVAKKQRRSK
jgi:tetratricopeptide (TPR) repeat protein